MTVRGSSNESYLSDRSRSEIYNQRTTIGSTMYKWHQYLDKIPTITYRIDYYTKGLTFQSVRQKTPKMMGLVAYDIAS